MLKYNKPTTHTNYILCKKLYKQELLLNPRRVNKDLNISQQQMHCSWFIPYVYVMLYAQKWWQMELFYF